MEISGNVLVDTNVYLRILRSADYARRHYDRFAELSPRIFLCSVVAGELYAGARSAEAVKSVDELLRVFLRTGRVVFPNHRDWSQMGRVAAVLWNARRDLRSRLPSLQNDILIALSARRVGATITTENESDFRLIGKHISIKLLPLMPS